MEFEATKIEILLLGHTGKVLSQDVIEWLKRNNTKSEIVIKALLKSPYSETYERSEQIKESVKRILSLKTNKILSEVRHYESMPVYGGYIVMDNNKIIAGKLYQYQWLPMQKTKASSEIIELNELTDPNQQAIKSAMNWFKHHWGTFNLHTLLFDFDDTLVTSFSIQVEAWWQTVIKLYAEGTLKKEMLHEDIASVIDNWELTHQCIRNIFITHQMAPAILKAIITNSAQSNSELVSRIIETRYEIRYALSIEKASLLPGVEENIKLLSKNFQLIIVSATSELLIKAILEKHQLVGYFSMILGKNDPAPALDMVNSKTGLILKIAQLTGIGCDRMLFIGDNNHDYSAAKQAKVKFIESGVMAQIEGYKSLIKANDDESKLLISDYKENKLYQMIMDIANKKVNQSTKEHSNASFL